MKKRIAYLLLVLGMIITSITIAVEDVIPTHAATTQGTIVKLDKIKSTNLGNERDVSVYLPPDYSTSTSQRYPVLYMADGQYAWPDSSDRDWNLNTTADNLIKDSKLRPVIIVAVASLIQTRDTEYGVGQGGDKYLKFLTDELMPTINQRFRTLTGPQNTAHMGSAQGGIISAYAALKRPDVFGLSASLSTSFTGSGQGIADLIKQGPKKAVHMYFDMGTSDLWHDWQNQMGIIQSTLKGAGYVEGKDVKTAVIQSGIHFEASWGARAYIPLEFLFGNASNCISSVSQNSSPTATATATSTVTPTGTSSTTEPASSAATPTTASTDVPFVAPADTSTITPSATSTVAPTCTPTTSTMTSTVTSSSSPTITPTTTVASSPTMTPTEASDDSSPTVTPTSTSSSSPVASGASPSGQPMPTGDLPGWKQIFAEDFTTNAAIGSFPGEAYGKKFKVYKDGWPDTAGKGGKPSRYYPSKVVSVNNGLLDKYLRTEDGTPMGAAVLPLLPDQLYGKYTIRFRSDALKGFKTAWLLWPESESRPRDGEIDFPEGDLAGTISAFMHHTDASSGGDQDAFKTTTTYTDWHTASIEWTEGKVVFILDDKVIGTSTERIPNKPMHYVIQTESCLSSCPSAETSGHLQIDWVAVYSPA